MLKAGDIVDRYTVEGEIAAGGMAEVYRVRHQQLGSTHALKVLVLRTQDIKRRLLQEGRVQAGLKHPNAIMVTDVVEVEGHPGLVMEYVDGPTLGDWVLVDRPGFAEIERVFREVVSAIGEAHRVGLIHRDLKPSNVLMARAGERRIPKVIDFGLAKVVQEGEEADHTRSGVPMGTPSYMAPEQIADAKNVDARADLFSLGALLYFMCCRRKAFEGANAVETYNAVLSGTYVPPDQVRDDIPLNLRRGIEACLRSDRDRRVRSAEDLLALLDGKDVPGASLPPPAGPDTSWVLWRAAVLGVALGVVGAGVFAVAIGPDAVLRRAAPVAPIATDPPPELEPGPVIEPQRAEEAPGAPVAPRRATPNPCSAPADALIGYAVVPARVKRGEVWVLDERAPLSLSTAAFLDTGCALPAGARVEVRDRPSRDGGQLWIGVYGGSFTMP